MSQTSQIDAELLQQLCVEEKEGPTATGSRFMDLFPPNLMSEEQWINFVLSQRGVDHIRDFFLRNYENSHIQWHLNKPLAGNKAGRTVLHIETRDQRNAVLSLLLRFGGMFVEYIYTPFVPRFDHSEDHSDL